MTKRIYVAGPMRGYEKWNFPAFDRNAEFLASLGWDPVSPADLDRQMGFDENDDTVVFGEAEFHEAMLRDYEAILRCDAIAFIPGWEKSTGAALERSFASRLKLDMYRVDADNAYLEKELVIGLTGYAQSGKNTLADILSSNYGFEQRAFADSLRGILYALNPRLPEPDWAEVGDGFGNTGVVRVHDYIDKYGWEYAKENVPEVRQLLQRLGTEGGRTFLGENVWVDGLFNKPHAARLVTTDCRFPSEISAVKERDGVVIRVERNGYGPVNSHVSETASLGLEDFMVHNDGEIWEMEEQVLEGLRERGVKL